MRSVGIMGGTFDPVHMGHLACAEMARDACGIDEVLFIVAGNPNFKQGMQMAPASERFAMVQAAIAGNDAFAASDAEVRREGVTYTADTLLELKDADPTAELSFIMGTDALLTLHAWKDADVIARLARIICVSRPGYALGDRERARLARAGFDVTIIEAPLLDISSSEVRQRVAEGRSIRYLVPDAVRAHIQDRRLYRREEA